jgi:hypothetical protein
MKRQLLLAACLGLLAGQLQAGVIDPDCDAGKAAKSAAMKATVGVGGRCSPKEALTDSVGIDNKKGALPNGKDAVKDAKGNVTDKVDNPTTKVVKKVVN